MREAGTGLLRKWRKCAWNSRGISEIRAHLVFRGANDQCSHNANEISAMRAELVFREVPGKVVEWCRHSQRFRSLRLRSALINPPRDAIAGIPITPVCLGPLTACRLAFRIPAGSLTGSHSRVGPEPPATDRARSLPGLGHRDDLSSSSRLQPPQDRRQFRMPGSFPESRGGSFLESAEGRSTVAGKGLFRFGRGRSGRKP